MIKKVLRILTAIVICVAGYMLATAPIAMSAPDDAAVSSFLSAQAVPAPAPAPAPPVTTDPQGSAVVSAPGVLEQFGPPGVLITTVLTGILMIIKSINEGKKIDVESYKQRATDAETRSDIEIGKVHKKLEELSTKLDEVIADRDEYRDLLEGRKAHFTKQILDMERRHQSELEGVHSALMIEVHTRHKLERLLVENGIEIPKTPPPYTRKMRSEVTEEDAIEVNNALPITSSLPTITNFEE